MIDVKPGTGAAPWRRRLHEVIFESDTRAGRAFDFALLVAPGPSAEDRGLPLRRGDGRPHRRGSDVRRRTAELAKAARGPVSTQACPACGRDGHDADAVHCKFCGAPL